MGVYAIQIEKEGYWQSYVGISNNIEQRWRNHKSDLKHNHHKNQYLQRSWNKYGEENFEFTILEQAVTYDELYKLEKEYTYTFGYGDPDLCFNVGVPGEINGKVGKKLSEETKEKISKAMKGEKSYWFGKCHTEETKRKMSESHRSKRISKETKQKMSEARQGEKNNHSKLTELQARFILTVKTIRKNKHDGDFKQQELANHFGVSVDCIKDIMIRRSWKHIEPLPIEEYEEFKKNL